jgi:predicted Zn-dependent peptidase
MGEAGGLGRLIDFTDGYLDNGLRVILVEDHLAPVVGVCVCYKVGSRYEQPGKTGLAHLFEHLMFEGSTNVGKTEHFAIVNSAGGTLNGGTGQDLTIYHEQLPSHQLELALWLEADRMGGLLDAVSQEALDNQRDVVKNERRSGMDNAPYGRHEEGLQEAVYPPGHPYRHSIIGSMDDLDQASLADVHDFFRMFYAPNNAVLCVSGDFNPAEARAWAEKHFGRIPAWASIPAAPNGSIPALIGKETRDSIRDRVSLSRIYVGYRSPRHTGDNVEFYALEMATRVLARGRNSRLHKTLVLDRQLAQDAAIYINELIGGPSMTVGVATSRPEMDIEQLEAAYHEVAGSLAGEPPSAAEMERVHAMLQREFADSFTEMSSVANATAWCTASFGDPEQLNRELGNRLAVTPEQIQAAAATYLVESNRAVLTFLPAETVAG